MGAENSEWATSDRRLFIDSVETALGRNHPRQDCFENTFPEPAAAAVKRQLETILARSAPRRQALLDLLAERGQSLNLKVIAVADPAAAGDYIADLVRTREPEWGGEKQVAAWQHPLIAEMGLEDILAPDGIPVLISAEQDPENQPAQLARHREQVVGAFVGVTAADYCLADTATLVMRTRPGQARSISLVPSIHIAVLRLEQILADLQEFYAVLRHELQIDGEGLTNCMTFISGPSKTADIELVMVHGAHGPRELCIIVVTG